jgi:predicted glycosyltransferase
MDPVKDAQHVRAKMGIGDEPVVAVMAGGGADAHPLMQAYMEALPFVRSRIPVATVMVTGPFMPEAERKALRDQARLLGVQIHTAVGDSLSHINAANAVVSMAGYNTLTEVLRFQKPAVVVPRPGPSAEQRMRARIFADRGFVSMVDPSEVTPERLARAIVDALANPWPQPAASLPALDGVAEATRMLLELLPQETDADRAAPVQRPPQLRVIQALSPNASHA